MLLGGGTERETDRQTAKPTSQAQEILLYNHNVSEENVTEKKLGCFNAISLGLLGWAAASPVNIKRKLRIWQLRLPSNFEFITVTCPIMRCNKAHSTVRRNLSHDLFSVSCEPRSLYGCVSRNSSHQDHS